ncbi:oxidoreductase [Brevibacterium sp. 5221]|uniref:Oxidoreductase n=1 Tax=Brevibacterium rongguiense TaxID=2695267 RepID=A0A6N9H513_9MICO|nr:MULTISPECIES: oxidoreductase [Brevibacterium]MYM19025.1 oxidoreductase [Brevibacterium rongguiense]WAL40685.1 oxidoreductase [Brevibacterium sp. BRM-1]
MAQDIPGGPFELAGSQVARMGFGTMQLPGPGVMGPPRDRAQALAVLRTAVDLGIDHFDTADYYGPDVSNELLREALHPFDGLTLVSKVGATRNAAGDWLLDRSPQAIRTQVEANLRVLDVEALDVVNLRLADPGHEPAGEVPFEESFAALAALREEGLVRELGLSVATPDHLAAAQCIAPVVEVQNLYNLANRGDDAFIAELAAQGIAYVPFFPLGGFTPLQSATLDEVAARLGQSPQAVALTWLLQRSGNILLIPGTSSVDHLRANVAAAGLILPPEEIAALDSIG